MSYFVQYLVFQTKGALTKKEYLKAFVLDCKLFLQQRCDLVTVLLKDSDQNPNSLDDLSPYTLDSKVVAYVAV